MRTDWSLVSIGRLSWSPFRWMLYTINRGQWIPPRKWRLGAKWRASARIWNNIGQAGSGIWMFTKWGMRDAWHCHGLYNQHQRAGRANEEQVYEDSGLILWMAETRERREDSSITGSGWFHYGQVTYFGNISGCLSERCSSRMWCERLASALASQVFNTKTWVKDQWLVSRNNSYQVSHVQLQKVGPKFKFNCSYVGASKHHHKRDNRIHDPVSSPLIHLCKPGSLKTTSRSHQGS